ncbi:MAG: hypothetical protein AABZ64_03250 [Nitrospinota bacterium]
MTRKPMKNMTEVAALILKEIRRRGGHEALAAKLERAIRAAKEQREKGKDSK